MSSTTSTYFYSNLNVDDESNFERQNMMLKLNLLNVLSIVQLFMSGMRIAELKKR
jgi:hypothetical protein